MGTDAIESSIDSVIEGAVALTIARPISPRLKPSAGLRIDTNDAVSNEVIDSFVTLLTFD